MPNYKKHSAKKLVINKKSKNSSLKEDLKRITKTKVIGYIKRQAARKAQEHTASERFSEISSKNKQKSKLKDADAPLTVKEKSANGLKKIIKYIKGHKKPRDERSVRHINPKVYLSVIIALCLALIVLSAINEKIRKPFKDVASVIIVPAQKGINTIGLWLSDKLEAQKTLEALEDENRILREKIDSLTLQISELTDDQFELKRLQELLKLNEVYEDYDVVGAHIIAKNSGKWFSTFTIDKGSNDGLVKDMNVIASGGLVGIITDVGPNFSTVRAIIDDESAVSGKFKTNSELCLINGSLTLMENNLLEFTNVAADVEITINSEIITSHVSSKFLPGILIGYVVDYQLDSNDLTQSGHLQPVVDFSNLEEVLVITTLKEVSD